MKSNSIQFKFFITTISAILTVAICIGALVLYEVGIYTQQQAEDLINTTSSNEVSQINDAFGDMEKSVRIMESYVLSFFKTKQDAQRIEKQNEVIEFAEEVFADVAVNTTGVIAYYLRFNPAISSNTSGLFYSKIPNQDNYVRFEPTDLSLYDQNDTEHVGWYWEPYEAGEPVWIKPYVNQNNNFFMISYVVPLYCEDLFVGVVGMDFDYHILTETVHEIKIYENGFAHLKMDDEFLHHGDADAMHTLPSDYEEQYFTVSRDLFNGMSLVLFASYDDILRIQLEIAENIIFSVIVLALAFSLIVFFMVKKIVKPIGKLTDASIKLASGDYEVEIEHSDTYEIQLLSTAFEKMATNLQEHEKRQHMVAYRDSLTGVKNTASYKKWVIKYNEKIQNEPISFGIVMFDINYLKEANDTYGHHVGNSLIVTASKLISYTFKRSPVFRIGGDEFLVILQNQDLEDREQLFAKFEAECASASVEAGDITIPVQIAKGFSLFDPSTDTQFLDVFNRADSEMYKNKETLKSMLK